MSKKKQNGKAVQRAAKAALVPEVGDVIDIDITPKAWVTGSKRETVVRVLLDFATQAVTVSTSAEKGVPEVILDWEGDIIGARDGAIIAKVRRVQDPTPVVPKHVRRRRSK